MWIYAKVLPWRLLDNLRIREKDKSGGGSTFSRGTMSGVNGFVNDEPAKQCRTTGKPVRIGTARTKKAPAFAGAFRHNPG